MCHQCVEITRRIWPEVPENKIGDFILCCTCFPMGDVKEIERQLMELREKTDDWRECYSIVEKEMNEAMEKYFSNNNIAFKVPNEAERIRGQQ